MVTSLRAIIRAWRTTRGALRDGCPEPLTLASYNAGPPVKAWVEHLAVGHLWPEMPLFLQAERYVPVPLEATYQAAYEGVPTFWRNVLEAPVLMSSDRSLHFG